MKRLCTPLIIILPLFAFSQSKTYRNLVLEGGGVKGFAYTGAFQVLDSLQILSDIERVGGTSAGAIQATLLATGYTPAEMAQVAANVPLRKFNDGGWLLFGGIKRIRKQFGWYKGEKIAGWIEELIAAKTGNGNITFAGLHAQKEQKGYKDLYITGTDLTWQCLRVFSYENYPDMRIKDAVRISLSIPFYYEAVLMDDNGKVYSRPDPNKKLHVMVDGGVLSNYPLFLFDSAKYVACGVSQTNCWKENPETLGLLLEIPGQIEFNKKQAGNYPFPIHTVRDYFRALYHTIIDKANPDGYGNYALHRTIAINNMNLPGRIRKLPPKVIDKLLENGRAGVRSYFGEGGWGVSN